MSFSLHFVKNLDILLLDSPQAGAWEWNLSHEVGLWT